MEHDLKCSFTELSSSVHFCTLETFLNKGAEINKDHSIRVQVVYEPFFFNQKFTSLSAAFHKSCKKSTKPIYVVSIMSDLEVIKRVMEMNPMIRVLVLFVARNEDLLMQSIRTDGQGSKIDLETVKKEFMNIKSGPFLGKLEGLGVITDSTIKEEVAMETSDS